MVYERVQTWDAFGFSAICAFGVVHEIQAFGVERRDRVSFSRLGEADVLGYGGRDHERGGGQRACSSIGVRAASAIGQQVGSETEGEDVLQVAAGI